jgi:Domain of unknown function (DUF3482)/Protein of unknown function (DUF2868)
MGHEAMAARMSMDEAAARRVMLAHAIESADTEGKLLSAGERDQIDRQARQAAGAGAEEGAPVVPERFLELRARHVIAAVAARNPGLASLQEPPAWQRWVGVGTPVLALFLGILTDVIANPHRVDLVSLPLLGIVAWNLVIYLALIAGLFMTPRAGRHAWLSGLGRWTDGGRAWRRRGGNLRAATAAQFHLRWYRATQALHLLRVKRVLHLAAAAWAIGISVSLLARGLVVEYRVGWESTFLDAAQVHAILSGLRLPALLLFPFQPFTVQEVAALRFSEGGGAIGGARWVYMYVALLLVVVVAPRVILATVAYARERLLSRRIPIDTGEPYYQRLLSLLSSACVQLCVLTHREADRAALFKVLVQEAATGRTLIKSVHDDVLRFVDLAPDQAPPPAVDADRMRWSDRMFGGVLAPRNRNQAASRDPALAAREDSDIAVHVVGGPQDLAAARPLLEWLGKPVLIVVTHPPESSDPSTSEPWLAQCRVESGRLTAAAEVLDFNAFARCWVQERVLLDAIGRLLPATKAAGYGRIVTAWERRNATRLERAMAAIAEHLLFAARQSEEVRSGALTVRNLMAAERQAQAQARQQAMDAVLRRLDASAAQMFSTLRELHGVDEAAALVLQHRLQEKFELQQAVDTPQAGMAGAATGAAMGASVDLLVGGLTLGAATALGALVGGSAAFIAAAWKNRATLGGNSAVQLSDEMLKAMTEAALLRYLAVVHHDRAPLATSSEAAWKTEVLAAVEPRKAMLTPFWTAARTQSEAGKLTLDLAAELEAIARRALAGLYPAQVAQAAGSA